MSFKTMFVSSRAMAWMSAVVAISCSMPESGAPDNGSGAAREVAKSTAALVAAGQRPVPCDETTGEPLFEGNRVSLMYMDALSSCVAGATWGSHGSGQSVAPVFTRYWTHATDMASRAAYHQAYPLWDQPLTSFERWFTSRTGDPGESPLFSNCSLAGDGNPMVGGVDLEHPIDIGNYRVGPTYDSGGYNHRASYETMEPAVRLCIAQQLRQVAPGSAGSEALLLTEHEQRHLLATIRDSVQLSMLQFAFITSLMSAPVVVNTASEHPLAIIQQWAAQATSLENARSQQMARMSSDFAAAVQLHVDVTQELADLLARSRSARSPTAPNPAGAQADDVWGAGSWQQRLLALAFGGDPLVNDENGGVWEHLARPGYDDADGFWLTTPAAPPSWGPQDPADNARFFDWPGKAELPYLRENIAEPQVWAFIGAARDLGVLELVPVDAGPVIDVPATAQYLFDEVEKKLRGPDCNGCTIEDNVEETLLWQRRGITRQHARLAANFLAAGVGQVLNPNQANPPREMGLYNLAGSLNSTVGGRFALNNTALVPRTLAQFAGAFTRYSSYFSVVSEQVTPQMLSAIPPDFGFLNQTSTPSDDIVPLAPSDYDSGYYGWHTEGARRLGAISALTLTRDFLVRSLAETGASSGRALRRQDLLLNAPKIIDVIDAAIGASGIVVRPEPHLVTLELETRLAPKSDPNDPNRSLRRVSITPDPSNGFWVAPPSQKYWIIVSDDPLASSLAAQPGVAGNPSSIHGRTIETIVSRALQDGSFAELVAHGTTGERYYEAVVPMAIEWTSGLARNTFFVMRATETEKDDFLYCPEGGEHWQAARFQLMAGDLPLRPGNRGDYPHFEVGTLRDVRAIAAGGTIGTFIDRQFAVLPSNPASPAYDGFGLPTDWVPPTDPALLASDSRDSARYFLDLSRRSAAEAAAAVDRAFQNLTEELADEASQAAATDRSSLLLAQASEALCGPGMPGCELPTTTTLADPNWYPSLAGWSPEPDCDQAWTEAVSWWEQQDLVEGNDPSGAKKILRCIETSVIETILSQYVEVADPVLEQLNLGAQSVPTFSQYAGGQFQSVLIEQFRALRSPDEHIASLRAATDVAVIHADAAAVAVDSVLDEQSRSCGTASLGASTGATVLGGAATGASIGSIACAYGAAVGAVAGAVIGGAIAMFSDAEETAKQCARLKDRLDELQAQLYTTYLESLSALRNTAAGTLNTMATMAQSGAAIHLVKNDAEQVKARAALEAELSKAGHTTSFGLVRQYRAYDMWRAKALVENARRYALAARRSIENRFVVNLSGLTDSEPFVSAPSTWSDEIYEYDLSLPAAVGLEVGQPQDDGIYPNKVLDYVGNLEAFIAGYTVDRPTVAGVEDVEVLTLPGLSVGVESDAELAIATRGQWRLFCPSDDEWVGLGTFMDARAVCTDWSACSECALGDVDCAIAEECYAPPTRAQLSFALDPWGRLNGSRIQEAFSRRHNTRWGLLAVNLVGTGIHECSQAEDPLGCYAQGFVDFDLVHRGVPWTTDSLGIWRWLAYPQGHIEAGKALAAEVWLDPLQDGWQTPYVAPITRSEFVDRPIGGDYELTIDVTPEVRLDRIERVQFLQGSRYWVSQSD